VEDRPAEPLDREHGCVRAAFVGTLTGLGFMAVVLLVFVGVMATMFSGCEDVFEEDRLGLTLNTDGSVRAVIPACASQAVRKIVLSTVNEDGAGRTLWEVRAATTPFLEQFTVGVAPEGFETKVAFDGGWPEGKQRLSVYAYSDPPPTTESPASSGGDFFLFGSTAEIDFERDEIHAADILIDGEHVGADRVEALGCPKR
jgi:hypothetical protein